MLRYSGSAARDADSCSAPLFDETSTAPRQPSPGFRTELTLVEEAKMNLDPLLARLSCFGKLSGHERAILHSITRTVTARPAEHILFHEDCLCDHVCVLTAGVACRYQILPGGRRQILGYVFPGDLCDLRFLTVGASDHNVSMLTRGSAASIGRAKMLEIVAAYPAIGRALTLAASVDQAILHQWLLNIGQRDATERLSHFLCEFVARMGVIETLHDDGSLPFEINQSALADTLGMSIVHVNRTLQSLRRAGLIQLHGRRLTIFDYQRLATIATFDPRYLHIRNAVH